MARPRKNSSNVSEVTLDNFTNYYFYLFKQRLKWTRHSIPVVCYDHNTRFHIEGYIETVSNVKTEEELAKTTVIFYPAFFPTNSDTPLYLLAKDIYPSNRTLYKFSGSDLVPLDICSEEIRDKFKIPYENYTDPYLAIYRFFKSYNTPFTILEVSSQLNIPVETVTKVLQVYGILKGKRNDLISGDMQDYFMLNEDLFTPSRQDIGTLQLDYRNCTRCILGVDRAARDKDLVYGRGDIYSDLHIIGEAPGIQEEASGIAFNPSAPAGDILYKVMSKANIDQNKCWITNSVLCRPASFSAKSQNGKPTVTCINTCSSRLKNEIAIGKPRIIVLLGSIAYSAYFNMSAPSVLKNTGWATFTPELKVYYMPHPSYIARQVSFAACVSEENSIKKSYLDNWLEIRKYL